jgi:hypothetical protein
MLGKSGMIFLIFFSSRKLGELIFNCFSSQDEGTFYFLLRLRDASPFLGPTCAFFYASLKLRSVVAIFSSDLIHSASQNTSYKLTLAELVTLKSRTHFIYFMWLKPIY